MECKRKGYELESTRPCLCGPGASGLFLPWLEPNSDPLEL